MSKRKTFFEDSALKNNITYIMYKKRLTNIAFSRFAWENLPESIDERFLEETLFYRGQILFFNDDVLGLLALPFTSTGQLDLYRNPINRRAYAVNGYHAERVKSNSVIMYNNMLRTNDIDMVTMFSYLLYNIERTIQVNVNGQKTPALLQGTEQQRLTLINLYKEYDGNAPVIFGDKNLDINSLKSISTGAPYVSDKLYDLKVKYWNEALTYLGITNISIEKRERLISDEVVRSQGGTIASSYSPLEMRRYACDKINKLFGTNINVKFRQNLAENKNITTKQFEQEGVEEIDE